MRLDWGWMAGTLLIAVLCMLAIWLPFLVGGWGS